MKIVSFQFDPRWIDLRNRLNRSDMTLSDLRALEDEVLLLMTDKTGDLGSEILLLISEKRESFIESYLSGKRGCDICKLLKMMMLIADSDQYQERLLLEKNSSSHRSSFIETLEFAQQESVVHELDDDPITSNFASRMKRISQMIREEQSIDPYHDNLNSAQKKEISLIACNRLGPKDIARAIDTYVKGLREQVKVAEMFYFGRMKEGMEALSKLKHSVQKRVDEMVWQSSGDVIGAIIHSVEEQMGMHSA